MPSSNYTPMSNNVAKTTLNDKYGHITVVTASFNLLLVFLRKQLFFLSTRDANYFGSIVDWAEKNMSYVEDLRQSVREYLEIVSFEYPSSASMRIFGCNTKVNEEGEEYYYSAWLQNYYKVTKEVAEENTLVLAAARADYLLDQICYRIYNIILRLKREANCEYDMIVVSQFERLLNNFKDLRAEAIEQVTKSEEFKKNVRENRPVKSFNQVRNTGKKVEKKVEKKPVETQNTVVVPEAPKTNLSNGTGYADAAAKSAELDLTSFTNNFEPPKVTESKPVENKKAPKKKKQQTKKTPVKPPVKSSVAQQTVEETTVTVEPQVNPSTKFVKTKVLVNENGTLKMVEMLVSEETLSMLNA